MLSLTDYHKFWLTDYHHSGLFNCKPGILSCEAYHVLTPLLYDMGVLKSYKSYQTIIINFISNLFSGAECPNILVAGIDSEASARAIIQILDLFRHKYSLTFIDCCLTPLNRINHCLEKHEKGYIKTSLVNIFTNTTGFRPGFDIIFSDSFLKQFSKSQKAEALRILSSFLKNPGSRLVIREYFGDQNYFLLPFWSKLEYIYNKSRDNYQFSTLANDKFLLLKEKLENYYNNTGKPYITIEELKADMKDAKLQIIDAYINESLPDKIIMASRLA